MTRHITAIIALLWILAMPCTAWAGKKKKQVIVRPELPMPDLRLPAQKPQQPLAMIKEIGIVQPKVKSHTGSYGPHTAHMHRIGIDVSHYQGQIDWHAVAREGKTLYAFCKATESTGLVDNTYQYNVREARRAGIPVSCYHFFSPTTSPMQQFENFKRTVDMKQLDVVPMLDVEVRGKQSLEQFQKNIRIWLKAFEDEYHFKPIIYASLNFYNKYLAAAFDDYIYMIAKYGEGTPEPEGPIPFAMWQYTSNGRVAGIRGAVDISCLIDHFEVKDILIKNQK